MSKPKAKSHHESPAKEETVQVTFRVPLVWMTRADALASRLSISGVPMTRTDGFRAAMAAGFDSFDLKMQSTK